ncbi:hypothetical protein [Mycolicibacterium lutetiense]
MKPTDPIGAAIVEGMWVEDAGIAMIKQVAEGYSAQQAQRSTRADELERARDGVQKSLESEHDEAMHARLRKITGDADRLAEDAGSIASTASSMAHTGEMAQMEMLGIVEHWRPIIEAYCRSGLYLDAAVALFCVAGARAEVANALATAIGDVQALGTRLNSSLATITPGSWATSGGQVQDGGSGNGSGVQAVDHTTPKLDGGQGGGGQFGGQSGRPSEPSPQSEKQDGASDGADDKSHGKGGTSHGDTDRPDGGSDKTEATSGQLSGTTARPDAPKPGSSALPATTAPPTSLGGGGSGSGLSGASGMTSPASGLGGLGRSPMDAAGLNGAMKSPVASSLPSTAPAGGGSGAGSGGGSGSGAGRLGGGGVPSVPAAPVTAVAPSASALSSSPAQPSMSPTPGFGSSSPAVQSAPHAAGPVGGPMAGMPAGGAMGAPAAPPPPSQVGPAPTPSPGLSQGSGAPMSPAAAAANAGLGGSAISAGAAPFTSVVPERVDRFAQMAVEAVKTLAPGIASAPGLVLAAAVVAEQGGSPEIVIMTNDGAGWLPEGFFLPPTMLHAAVDLDDDEFDGKWFGWADPARTLIDYVVVRDKRSHREVRLLGLASMGPLSEQTRTIFPEAVPSVSAERDAQPLTSDRGRNAHRLKVQDKGYYEDVRRAGESGRRELANQALEAVMLTTAAAAIRPQWELLLRDGWLPDAEWAALKARYEHERMMVGALRPGFTAESVPGQAAGLMYVNRFWELRAMETLLLWGREDCPVEEIVYTASAAAATIGPVPA